MTVTDSQIYCKVEDKTAIITFGSASTLSKTIRIKDVPINVTRGFYTKDTSQDFPIGDRCILYNVTVKLYYSVTEYYTQEKIITTQILGPIEGIFVDYSQWNQASNYRQTWYVIGHGRNGEICTLYSQNIPLAASPNMVRQEPYTLIDIAPANPNYVPNTPPYSTSKKIYYITFDIDDYNIYREESSTEFTYSVSCDGCPPGTIKCLSTNYPGYCCLPCSEIKNEIKAIASQIRSLNHG